MKALPLACTLLLAGTWVLLRGAWEWAAKKHSPK